MPEAVLVVDLDGTILAGNSYKTWVWWMLFGPFRHLAITARLRVRMTAFGLLMARKLLGVPHARVKSALRRNWRRATAGDPAGRDLTLLLQRLDGDVRPWFRPLLAAIAARRCDAVMATAAAGEYAEPFGRHLGFDAVLSSGGDPSTGVENLGAHKAEAVTAWLAARGWSGRPLIVFTDHVDDLPLAGLATTLVWFGDAAGLAAVAQRCPALHHVAPSAVDAAALLGQLAIHA